LIELNGNDLRRDPLDVRKATLASVLAKAAPGIRARARRHRLEAQELALSLRPLTRLAQD